MAKKYTRKQLGSLDQLDLEQERIRDKSKKIETDFVQALNPQQLVISFLGGFISRKIAGNKKEKGYAAYSRPKDKTASANSAKGKMDSIRKHPLFKSLLKKAGISFLKWQAFNLALFAGKKIYQAIKDKKKQKPLATPVSYKK
jgi:predicted methyltransferase